MQSAYAPDWDQVPDDWHEVNTRPPLGCVMNPIVVMAVIALVNSSQKVGNCEYDEQLNDVFPFGSGHFFHVLIQGVVQMEHDDDQECD